MKLKDLLKSKEKNRFQGKTQMAGQTKHALLQVAAGGSRNGSDYVHTARSSSCQKCSPRRIPHSLTNEQRRCRVDCCEFTSVSTNAVQKWLGKCWQVMKSSSWKCQCAHSSYNNRLSQRELGTAVAMPYSPDVSPCDFFLFPEAKKQLKSSVWERRKCMLNVHDRCWRHVQINWVEQCNS